MASIKSTHRYPRAGERIAPQSLREVLQEPIPREWLTDGAADGLCLCDLDETAWTRFPTVALRALAELVVDRVSAGCARRTLHNRHFPRPPEGLRFESLRLEHRTQLCLAREGFDENPQALGDCSIGDVLAIRSFGPRCLVDLLSALETHLARGCSLDAELTAEARRLADIPHARLARSDDPRFGPLIDAVDINAADAARLARGILDRVQDPPDSRYAAEQVRALSERILALPALALEEELIEIFAATPHQRNREILVGYYGWGDGKRHTLAEIGARYGMTRERTRQICAKLVRRKSPREILAPVTDRVLAFVEQRLPAAVEQLEADLRSGGFTRSGLGLDHVVVAAGLLGRPQAFQCVRVGERRLCVRPEHADLPPVIIELATKEVYYHGLANIGQIVDQTAARLSGGAPESLVRETLALVEGFQWLDAGLGWFRLRSVAKHGLPKALDKILAVAGRITVARLRAAIARNRRIWQEPPPESVLLDFCRQMAGVGVEGQCVFSTSPRDWRRALRGVERQLVEILIDCGPILERSALEDLCVARGMNRFSFHAFVACSPVVEQFGHSVYGLVGTAATPEQIDTFIAQRRSQRIPAKVLDSHGQTDDGKVWLSYRLSKAASTYAVITVPAALKEIVHGRFRLLGPRGEHVGTLAAKDGRAWGLGAFLRQQHAQTGDTVTITLDLARREAAIVLSTDGSP